MYEFWIHLRSIGAEIALTARMNRFISDTNRVLFLSPLVEQLWFDVGEKERQEPVIRNTPERPTHIEVLDKLMKVTVLLSYTNYPTVFPSNSSVFLIVLH